MSIKFSVIIPAYNAEKVIKRCLESVLCQNFPNNRYEIIVVDDCSPDNQNNVVSSYVATYGGVKLLKHKENKRQGGARNTGLRKAKGEWIFFLDADDFWCRSDVFQTFESLIIDSDCDLIESETYVNTNHFVNGILKQTPELRIMSPDEYYSREHHPCIWTSVYRKTLIENIPFRENVYYEDTDWKILVYTNARNIGITDYDFYGYYENVVSTTHVKTSKLFRDALVANNLCRIAYSESGLSDIVKTTILKSGVKNYINLLFDLRNYKWNEAKILIVELINTPPIRNKEFKYSLIELLITTIAKYLPYIFITILFSATKLKRFLKNKG